MLKPHKNRTVRELVHRAGAEGFHATTGCRKVSYYTRDMAKRWAKQFKTRKIYQGKSGKRLSVYYCDACSAWHVGHTWADSNGILERDQLR